MAQTGFFHHVGTFFLFAAFILVLVTTISSPVVDHIDLMRVELSNRTNAHDSALTFGTFGHCVVNTLSGHDACSHKTVGYSPAAVLAQVGTERTTFSHADADVAKALTKVMILHPIATGILFLAFLLAIGAGVIGSFFAALVAFVGFLVTLVVLITDFVLFHLVKTHVLGTAANGGVFGGLGNNRNGGRATYGAAIWTLLAGAICALLGMLVVFFSCCSARLHRRRTSVRGSKVDPTYAAPRRRRFF
ncbi:pal1-like protein [Niveomyces insectorum RCEF 264]|uniref:Pal1-like protein n=1 Tax=Niveomyces insectorum RCEF 264 TaxID=1081102 RepID=A0A167MEW0_9HYPO|nr:pal1-like protein [Niveomyces insectorum RCEF 264]